MPRAILRACGQSLDVDARLMSSRPKAPRGLSRGARLGAALRINSALTVFFVTPEPIAGRSAARLSWGPPDGAGDLLLTL